MNAISEADKGKNLSTSFQYGLDTSRRPFWYDRGMLEGKCPNCGTYHIGWALRNPRHQTCPKCGSGLEITEDGHKVISGYSPFTAKRHFIDLPTNVPSPDEKEKDSHVPNE